MLHISYFKAWIHLIKHQLPCQLFTISKHTSKVHSNNVPKIIKIHIVNCILHVQSNKKITTIYCKNAQITLWKWVFLRQEGMCKTFYVCTSKARRNVQEVLCLHHKEAETQLISVII